ncbi:hypothetical protein SO802_014918 [Lithocarpus litseifolius]|uniref:Uncharacterized protein n=1 Tax=Lithocarpus litseifolius TaxID=425828 RepID=A0AAW2CSW1_9ROSI
MNKRRNIEVIKNGHPKKSPCSLVVIKNGRPKKSPRSSGMIKNGHPKKLTYSLAVIKNDRPKKLAHFQDQAMIPQTSKKTFKRQILRSCRKNTTILEEESS